MNERILQLNFKFNVSREEYEKTAGALGGEFAKVAGLDWKIWLMNEGEKEAGGIYLFQDNASLKAFLNGPLAKQVSSHPAFSKMSVKQFEVMSDVTAVTRGPVEMHAGSM